MNRVRLGKICEINPAPDRGLTGETRCTFVPMDAVDDSFGIIARRETRQVDDVQNGYTFFREGDVLFAKITPCMENGKCAIAKQLTNGIGFGSTEFHVIRANGEVSAPWIFYFIRQSSIRKQAEHRMTGSAGQKRVPASFLDELEIPLPSCDEQNRIVAILEKADNLRRTRHYARQLSDTFLESVFLEMFGDPVQNAKGWKKQKLADISEIRRGASPRPIEKRAGP